MTDIAVNTDIIERTFTTQREENERAFAALAGLTDRFTETVSHLEQLLRAGGKLLFCGNGGSASSASHMVNDCVGHMYVDRDPIRAVSISDNSAVLTALSNDYGYDVVFERQVRALAQSGDALIAISTSGNSENVLRAARTAQQMGVTVVALTGRGSGALGELADHWLPADSDDLVCAEHVHLFLLHTLTEALEAVLHPNEPAWGKTRGVRSR